MTICFCRLFVFSPSYTMSIHNDELPFESNSAIDQVSSFREIDADKRSSIFILLNMWYSSIVPIYNYSFFFLFLTGYIHSFDEQT